MESENSSRSLSQSQSTGSLLPWFMWACAATFFFYQFVVRVSPSVIATDLMKDLKIQACSLGVLSAFYYYGYTSMQIPAGLILDRFGVRLPLTLAALLCGGACFIFATTDNLLLMQFGRLLMGVGSAFGFLSCVKTASVWFSPKRLNILIGLSMLIGVMGGVWGGAPLSMLSASLGWRGAILCLSIASLALAAAVLLIVKNRTDPHEDAEEEETTEENEFSLFQSLWIILKNPYTWVFGLFGMLTYVPLAVFGDLWGVPFVTVAYGVDATTAAGSVSMFYMGVGAGGPLSAWIIDMAKSHKIPMRLGALFAAAIFLIVMYVPDIPFYMTYPLFFLAGLFSSTQFFAFASVVEINPRSVSGSASGVHNMLNMTSGVIFQPFVGWLLDYSWNGTLIAGEPAYAPSDYYYALTVIPLCLAIAVVVTFVMKETYPKD